MSFFRKIIGANPDIIDCIVGDYALPFLQLPEKCVSGNNQSVLKQIDKQMLTSRCRICKIIAVLKN